MKFFLLAVLFVHLHGFDCVRTKVQMGTYVTISLEKEDCAYSKKGFHIIDEIENSLSSYKKSSIISKLNQNKYAKLDKYSYEALHLSQGYYKTTNGYFDILIGSITKDLYRFGDKERVAQKSELKKAKVGFDLLRFNKQEAFLKPRGKVDLGGMGKGYAVGKVIEFFKTKNVQKAVVAASGDIRCLGTCSISVQDPFSYGMLASFETKNFETGISTSGVYNRYVKDQKHNHLIDPKTKQSEKEFLSVTLVSTASSSNLDAYATAVSVMPKAQAYSFLDSQNIAYIILESNNTLKVSSNFSKFAQNLVFYNAYNKQDKDEK